MVTVMIDLQ